MPSQYDGLARLGIIAEMDASQIKEESKKIERYLQDAVGATQKQQKRAQQTMGDVGEEATEGDEVGPGGKAADIKKRADEKLAAEEKGTHAHLQVLRERQRLIVEQYKSQEKGVSQAQKELHENYKKYTEGIKSAEYQQLRTDEEVKRALLRAERNYLTAKRQINDQEVRLEEQSIKAATQADKERLQERRKALQEEQKLYQAKRQAAMEAFKAERITGEQALQVLQQNAEQEQQVLARRGATRREVLEANRRYLAARRQVSEAMSRREQQRVKEQEKVLKEEQKQYRERRRVVIEQLRQQEITSEEALRELQEILQGERRVLEERGAAQSEAWRAERENLAARNRVISIRDRQKDQHQQILKEEAKGLKWFAYQYQQLQKRLGPSLGALSGMGKKVVGTAMRLYWTGLSAVYAVRNTMGPLIDLFRTGFEWAQRFAGAIAGLGQRLAETAGEIQTMRGRMAGMFGGQAEESIDYAIREAIGKPFEWTEIAEGMLKAMAMGLKQLGTDLQPQVITFAEDLAAAFQKPVDETVMAMMRAAYGNWQRMTRSFGFTAEQAFPFGYLRDPDTPAEVRRNLESIMKMVEARVGGTAQNLGHTWGALMSDMVDIWKRVSAELERSGFLDYFSAVLEYIRGAYEAFEEQGIIKQWSHDIVSALNDIRDPLGYIVEQIPSLVAGSVAGLTETMEIVFAWYDEIGGFPGLLEKIFQKVQQYAPMMLKIFTSYLSLGHKLFQMVSGFVLEVLDVYQLSLRLRMRWEEWETVQETIESGVAFKREMANMMAGARGWSETKAAQMAWFAEADPETWIRNVMGPIGAEFVDAFLGAPEAEESYEEHFGRAAQNRTQQDISEIADNTGRMARDTNDIQRNVAGMDTGTDPDRPGGLGRRALEVERLVTQEKSILVLPGVGATEVPAGKTLPAGAYPGPDLFVGPPGSGAPKAPSGTEAGGVGRTETQRGDGAKQPKVKPQATAGTEAGGVGRTETQRGDGAKQPKVKPQATAGTEAGGVGRTETQRGDGAKQPKVKPQAPVKPPKGAPPMGRPGTVPKEQRGLDPVPWYTGAYWSRQWHALKSSLGMAEPLKIRQPEEEKQRKREEIERERESLKARWTHVQKQLAEAWDHMKLLRLTAEEEPTSGAREGARAQAWQMWRNTIKPLEEEQKALNERLRSLNKLLKALGDEDRPGDDERGKGEYVGWGEVAAGVGIGGAGIGVGYGIYRAIKAGLTAAWGKIAETAHRAGGFIREAPGRIGEWSRQRRADAAMEDVLERAQRRLDDFSASRQGVQEAAEGAARGATQGAQEAAEGAARDTKSWWQRIFRTRPSPGMEHNRRVYQDVFRTARKRGRPVGQDTSESIKELAKAMGMSVDELLGQEGAEGLLEEMTKGGRRIGGGPGGPRSGAINIELLDDFLKWLRRLNTTVTNTVRSLVRAWTYVDGILKNVRRAIPYLDDALKLLNKSLGRGLAIAAGPVGWAVDLLLSSASPAGVPDELGELQRQKPWIQYDRTGMPETGGGWGRSKADEIWDEKKARKDALRDAAERMEPKPPSNRFQDVPSRRRRDTSYRDISYNQPATRGQHIVVTVNPSGEFDVRVDDRINRASAKGQKARSYVLS